MLKPDGILVLDFMNAEKVITNLVKSEIKVVDGIQFEAIEEVEGAGTTYQSRSYQILDKNPYSGTSYYRLKQTDFDGTFSYSPLRVVYIKLGQQNSFNEIRIGCTK